MGAKLNRLNTISKKLKKLTENPEFFSRMIVSCIAKDKDGTTVYAVTLSCGHEADWISWPMVRDGRLICHECVLDYEEQGHEPVDRGDA